MALPEGKMFDAEKMEIVDKPTPAAATTETATEVIEEEAPKEEEVPNEEEPTAEETQTEETPTETPKDDSKTAPQEDEPVGVDDYIKGKYGDLGIESEDQLDSKLAEYGQLQERATALETELAALKASADKPKFSSEQEEKAYEFLKLYDVTRMDQGMQTLARIVTMDIEKADSRVVLEEKFILDNPELTREESIRKFNKTYIKKYTLNKEDFEDEAKYNEELEDLRIDEKGDVAKAKKFLAQKQKEFRSAPKEEAPKESPVVQQNIQKTVGVLDNYMANYQGITYAPTENESDNFTINFTKEQLKAIQNAAKGWVSNPNSYNANGEIEGGFQPDEKIMQVAYLLYGEDIAAKIWAHAMSQADIKQADKIAKIKPTREVKTTGGKPEVNLSEEKQWDIMKRQKALKNANKPKVYIS